MRKTIVIYLLQVLFACLSIADLAAQTDIIKVDEDRVVEYTDLDEQPVFKNDVSDSFDSLRRYLNDRICYPDETLKHHISGTVYVSYVVLENGKVDQVKVLKGFGYGLDDEAMRVIRLTSGLWVPGKRNGIPVKTRMVLPIKFRL